MSKHPIQPLELINGTVRFKANVIVQFLLEAGPFDMNELARREFSREDREQFAQLIGYSLCGFGELSYVRNKTYEAAERMAQAIKESAPRSPATRVSLVSRVQEEQPAFRSPPF